MTTIAPSYVLAIGSEVLTGPVYEEDHYDTQSAMTYVPLPRDYSLRKINSELIRELLNSFSSIHMQLHEAHHKPLGLHLVIPTPVSLHNKDIIMKTFTTNNNNSSNNKKRNEIYIKSVHTTASVLCMAAFSPSMKHINPVPNVLYTLNGAKRYCDWETQTNNNKQRFDILKSHGGILPVVVVEVGKEYSSISVAEVEMCGREASEDDSDDDNPESGPEAGQRHHVSVRLLSTCGTVAFGWREADLQFTAAQLAEIYASERGDACPVDFTSALSLSEITKEDKLGASSVTVLPNDNIHKDEMSEDIDGGGLKQLLRHSILSDDAVKRRKKLLKLIHSFLKDNNNQTSKLVEVSGNVKSTDTTLQSPPSPSRPPSSVRDNSDTPSSTDTLSKLLPSHLFPPQVPMKFLQAVLPRLASEVTRPIINETLLSACPSPAVPVTLRLRDLLWVRYKELEIIFAKQGHLNNVKDKSLSEIEQLLQEACFINDINNNEVTLNDLCWQSSRPSVNPSKQPSTLLSEKKRSTSVTDDNRLHHSLLFSQTRSVSSQALHNNEILKSLTLNETSVLDFTEGISSLGLQDLYMQPFQQYLSNKQNESTKEKDVKKCIEFNGIDLKIVIDNCLNKALEMSRINIINADVGLDSPSKHRPEASVLWTQTLDDESLGWKTTLECDDVLKPPKMILLHIDDSKEQKLFESVLLSSQNEKQTHVSSLPGIYSHIYKSILKGSQIMPSSSSLTSLSLHRNSSRLLSVTSNSSANSDSDESRDIQRVSIYRDQAQNNIIVSEMNSKNVFGGEHILAREMISSSQNKPYAVSRIYEAPLNIGIRVVSKPKDLREDVEGNSEQKAKKRNLNALYDTSVLWVLGNPPEGCAAAVLRPVEYESLLIETEESDDMFYDEHIEKFYPAVGLLDESFDDQEVNDKASRVEDKDKDKCEDENLRDSCWRECPSLSSAEENIDIMTDGSKYNNNDNNRGYTSTKQESSKMLNNTSNDFNHSCSNVGLSSLFQGGYRSEIQLQIVFHNQIPPEELPPSCLWSACQHISESVTNSVNSTSCKFGSDESRSSSLTTIDENHNEEVLKGVIEVKNHSLVQKKNGNENGFHNENIKSMKSNVDDELDVSQWALEVVQYMYDPAASNDSSATNNSNISVLFVIPFPSYNLHNKHTSSSQMQQNNLNSFKCSTSSNRIDKEIVSGNLPSSYLLDLKIDAMSGLVSCELMGKNIIDETPHKSQEDGTLHIDTRKNSQLLHGDHSTSDSIFIKSVREIFVHDCNILVCMIFMTLITIFISVYDSMLSESHV